MANMQSHNPGCNCPLCIYIDQPNSRGTPLQTALASLTPLERQALASAHSSMEGNGYDFGFAGEVAVAGLGRQAVGALVANLIKKGLLCWDNTCGQVWYADQHGVGGKEEVALAVAAWLNTQPWWWGHANAHPAT